MPATNAKSTAVEPAAAKTAAECLGRPAQDQCASAAEAIKMPNRLIALSPLLRALSRPAVLTKTVEQFRYIAVYNFKSNRGRNPRQVEIVP
jgi:hypothetical protein